MATALPSVTLSPRQRRSLLPVLGKRVLPIKDEALVGRAALTAKPKDQDLEDVQEVVLEEYWRRVRSYDANTGVPLHGFLWPYLVGAARHIVRQDRDMRRSNGLGFEIPVNDMTCYDSPVAAGPDIGPDTSHEVRRFVRCLDDITRYIVVRRYWHDISLAQIAKEIGMRPQSVKRRLDKAVTEGRDALSATYIWSAT